MLRITPNDDLESAILKMAGGFAASLKILTQIVEEGPKIDPDLEHSGLGHMLLLDRYGIYGTDIYMLFNDKCGGDLRKLLLLIRATQLGKYPESKLKELAGDQFNQVSISDEVWEELDYVVCGEVSGRFESRCVEIQCGY